jgi:hypothetical protein
MEDERGVGEEREENVCNSVKCRVISLSLLRCCVTLSPYGDSLF